MKNAGIIGVGNCGSQVADLAEGLYSELFDCVYINTSSDDLAMVKGSGLKFKIEDEEEDINGSGKNRTTMKEYLEKNIETILNNKEFQNVIIEKKKVFIISSAPGGTGSGAVPVLYEFLRVMFPDTDFIVVGVMPKMSSASLMELGNTLEYLDEIYNVIGDGLRYMMYDNDSRADLPDTVMLETVNREIVEDLRVLTGIDNYSTPYESIDPADFDGITSAPGRIIVVRVNKGITEKNLEDDNLDKLIIRAIKNSCHVETDRNKKIAKMGVITYFTKPVNDLYRSSLDGVREFLGEPIERFNHNAINDTGNENLNFLYLIASGLSPINDRVQKITDRIAELKEKLPDNNANKYILSGDNMSYDAVAKRKAEKKRADMPDSIDKSAIFKRFKK